MTKAKTKRLSSEQYRCRVGEIKDEIERLDEILDLELRREAAREIMNYIRRKLTNS